MTQQVQKRLGQTKLILIFAIAFLPLGLAASMYYNGWGTPANTANKGDLQWPPLSIKQLNAKVEGGQNFTPELKWMLVITGQGDCNQTCQQMLHTTRQVNRALGKNADRVHRLLVMSRLKPDVQIQLRQEYPALAFAISPVQALNKLSDSTRLSDRTKIKHKSENAWSIWVADPHGNMMLHYSEQHSGKDILTDMKRLLKLSSIG